MAAPPRLRSGTLGERALRFEIAAPTALLARAARQVVERDPSLDAAAGSASVVVVAPAPIDPLRRAALTTALAEALASARAEPAAPPRRHAIDVAYDGPDLAELAASASMTPEDFAKAHAEGDYLVELGGFLPGFAYLGDLAPRLRAPRRPQPRARVPAGAVAVAGRQTGIYPSASPGGWNLVGRARLDAPLFDPSASPPARFAVGDRVSFRPIPAASLEVGEPASAPSLPRERAALVIERAAAVATIQDGGRARWLFAGVPASGALDPVALAAANLAVGNDPAAAGLEIAAGSLRLVATRALTVSVDGDAARRLAPGDVLEVPTSPRLASYVALRGGLDVAPVLGTRSTSLAARLGGLSGRALRRGDALAVGDDPGTPIPDRRLLVVPGVADETVLRIDVIPPIGLLDASSIEALLTRAFTVSTRLDRVGVRLDGGPVPRGPESEAKPEPVLPGAVQIAGDGTPMILGPDAAVTGGYPLAGVLRKTSLWSLFRLRPGARVRFARASSG